MADRLPGPRRRPVGGGRDLGPRLAGLGRRPAGGDRAGPGHPDERAVAARSGVGRAEIPSRRPRPGFGPERAGPVRPGRRRPRGTATPGRHTRSIDLRRLLPLILAALPPPPAAVPAGSISRPTSPAGPAAR